MKILELLMRETLPQRSFFRASEVSDLLKIKPHEMRYWETEFPQVRPQKTRTGQRIYRRQDVILFSAIRHLLQEKKLSLASAQRIIAESDDLFQIPPQKPEDRKSNAEEFEALQVLDSPPVHAQEAAVVKGPTETPIALEPPHPNLDDRLLADAAKLLAEDAEDFEDAEAFNQITQEIYLNCAVELEQASPKLEPKDVGGLIHDVMTAKKQTEASERLSKPAYEKTLASLKESRNSLTELLGMLDRIHESNFWHGFNG